MKLFEVLDRAVEWEWTTEPLPNTSSCSAIFHVGEDKDEYHVKFYRMPIYFDNKRYDYWELLFFYRDKDGKDHEDITGTGHALEVFSTVSTIAKDFVKKADPKLFAFASRRRETSRVKLYTRFAKQLKQAGWTPVEHPDFVSRYDTTFMLARPGPYI